MEYRIKKLATLAGVSPRTLRYYDQINLLKPARINSSGYRIYGTREVDQLQQILFYRELGLDLDAIARIVLSPDFEDRQALQEHRSQLLVKKLRIEQLLANVEKTLEEKEGGDKMSDQDKFEGFKEAHIAENEKKYGTEIRERYGDEVITASNQKLKKMTKEAYNRGEELALQVNKAIKEAFQKGDPSSKDAMKACELHKQWLMLYWPEYSKEAHRELGEMYVKDERFRAYYDKIAPGSGAFLRDALRIYTGLV